MSTPTTEQKPSVNVSPWPNRVELLDRWAAEPASVPKDDVDFWTGLCAGILGAKDPDRHVGLVRMLVAQRDPDARMDGFGKMFAPWYRQRRRGGRYVLVHRPGSLKTITGLIHFTNRGFAQRMGRQIRASHMLVAKIDIDDIIAFGVVTSGVAIACLPEEVHTQIRIDELWVPHAVEPVREETDDAE